MLDSVHREITFVRLYIVHNHNFTEPISSNPISVAFLTTYIHTYRLTTNYTGSTISMVVCNRRGGENVFVIHSDFFYRSPRGHGDTGARIIQLVTQIAFFRI